VTGTGSNSITKTVKFARSAVCNGGSPQPVDGYFRYSSGSSAPILPTETLIC
jgi:hypothetical protein